MNLQDYQLITKGITHEDMAFYNAVMELQEGLNSEFYTLKRQAYNKLNHAMIGKPYEDTEPIKVIGVLDFEMDTLALNQYGREVMYHLDDLDPAYVDYIKATILASNGSFPKRVPLSELAVEVLDEQFKDVEKKPEFVQEKKQEIPRHQQILQRSFANEMVLMVQLDEYIQKHNLEHTFVKNKDELLHHVGQQAFAFNFKDKVKELKDDMITPLEL